MVQLCLQPVSGELRGSLIDKKDYQTAENFLNGDSAVKFGEWWQSLFEKKLAPGTSQSPADHETGFLPRLAMDGNWVAVKALEKYGTTCCSCLRRFWAGTEDRCRIVAICVSATSKHPQGASAFIEFAIQDKYLAQFSDAVGLIPATSSAAQMTKNYRQAPARSFFELSKRQGTLRPVTPAYAFISPVFQGSFRHCQWCGCCRYAGQCNG